MPIKPENVARYPKDWAQIREQILNRARHRCEHDGCLARHREIGYWLDDVWMPLPRTLREAGFDKPGQVMTCADGTELKLIMIVLTIAHLDHTPEHNADANLRAWCQRHHLRYDAAHHKQTVLRHSSSAREHAGVVLMIPCISILQPWAHLIVNGHKDIENRAWKTAFRGRILIHAGKSYEAAVHDHYADDLLDNYGITMPAYADMPRGGIVGSATITDCVREHPSRWKMADCWGFVLADQRVRPFVACRGQLGIFRVPEELIA